MAFRGTPHYTSVPDTIIPIPAAPTLGPLATSSAYDQHSPPPAATWESLRRQARSLENEIEAKLAMYARHGTAGDGGGAGRAAANGVELEVEHLINKLTSTVNLMAQSLDNAPTGSNNPSMMHMLQRHRDILYDYSKEFKKTKANIIAARDHADLLSGSSTYKSPAAASSSTQDYLLNERGRIDGTHRVADEVLQAAYATRADLNDQRSMLYGAKGRVGGVLAHFPLVNDLMSRINTRKRRDSLIMAGVISFCIVLLFWYMLR
ncbi:snare region anchored in the vesicle membrane C-terminus-domain-containing protein [Fimicolochytrium jonesii]|uniref:snare region anchored in the vesicle membrane C-terminus-domain-containing protein n=1 Tax=Fimicolochytrium jonesii TaxID=1396493 RepID=UPI0022FE795B|nr:snare region anchored in the vesicle membrane C-terminus-domain-containing protein [Fimicolochytrium jonesii]KAI8816490.1 snare region anchored in the vesicle membrane C-terminus-domain-containing protein [Fimicolochytrium jonesii]